MSTFGTVYDLERAKATGNDPESLHGEIKLLRDALEWIKANYANQDLGHEDFRVEAYVRALTAFGELKTEKAP